MKTSDRRSSSPDRRRWTTSLDLDVRVVETSRGPIEVATAGDGPAVLMLHGIPGSWRQCVPLAEDLAAKDTDGFSVVLPSRPGYGRSPLRSGRTYEEQADLFVALLDALGIERFSVFGISGGGPAAVATGARQHDRVTALVLACAMAPHLTRIPGAMRFAMAPGIAEVLTPLTRLVARRRVRSDATIDAELKKSLTAGEHARMLADRSIRTELIRFTLGHQEAPAGLAGLRNDGAQIAASHPAASRAGPPSYDVRCPVLVMSGDADTVVTRSHAEFYEAALPGAGPIRFEDAGHVFALTCRAESSTAIRTFLEQAD